MHLCKSVHNCNDCILLYASIVIFLRIEIKITFASGNINGEIADSGLPLYTVYIILLVLVNRYNCFISRTTSIQIFLSECLLGRDLHSVSAFIVVTEQRFLKDAVFSKQTNQMWSTKTLQTKAMNLVLKNKTNNK